MKQRVISALIGLLILGAVLAFIGTKLFNAVIAAVSVMALFEMLRAAGCLKNLPFSALSFCLAALIPFCNENAVKPWSAQIIFLFALVFFVLLIKNSPAVPLEQASVMFLFSLFIPLFFSCSVFMRDLYGPVMGGFYLLFALGCAWFCDTFAFFTGRKFGKHKLAPTVSPKKTVEGAIGGLIGSAVSMSLLAFLFVVSLRAFHIDVRVHYPLILLSTPVCAILGMLGDLSASVIKRQFNVKDYGTIMPGHGGIMDRFDSVLFTLPATFILSRHISLISTYPL